MIETPRVVTARRLSRRRPVTLHGVAAAAADDTRFVFDTLDDVPKVIFADELWRVVDLRFLRSRFGTPHADRLTAIVADGRICVAAKPWFVTDENSINECGMYTGAIASRRFNDAFLVETRLPRYRSPLAEKYPHVLNWLERLTIATVEGRVS